MARCTVQSRVHASQRKARKLQVIEIRALPVVNRMTLLALRRESRSDVIRRGRLLEGFLVAGVALNGKTLKLPNRRALVTIRTVQARVTAHQRKAVVVLLDPLGDDAPALYRVTLLAAGAHLAAMDIGVTVGAVCPRVGEHWLRMTLGAGNALVLAV